MQIPVTKPFLPPFQEFSALAEDIFNRGYVSNFAKYCQLLEERASAILETEILSVVSCDVGMTLAWKALGLGSGEVIVPSFTFASTVNALAWNGLTPIFADIEPSTLCLDPAAVRELVGPDTVAIAAVHCFGEPVSLQIDQIAAEKGLALVFDAAHGMGTTCGGRPLAARGDATLFSLSGTKIVTAGEGGLAAFRDPAVRRRFEELRGYGFIADYDAKNAGLNGKMSELNAALGYLSLGMLGDLTARREVIAARYRRQLASYGLRFQPPAPENDTRSYKDFVVLFASAAHRAAAEAELTHRGIGTKRYFRPAHTMVAYRDLPRRSDLMVTDEIWDRALCIPMYNGLSDAQVDVVSAALLQGQAASGQEA